MPSVMYDEGAGAEAAQGLLERELADLEREGLVEAAVSLLQVIHHLRSWRGRWER